MTIEIVWILISNENLTTSRIVHYYSAQTEISIRFQSGLNW